MPGEADRLKKENEELERLLEEAGWHEAALRKENRTLAREVARLEKDLDRDAAEIGKFEEQSTNQAAFLMKLQKENQELRRRIEQLEGFGELKTRTVKRLLEERDRGRPEIQKEDPLRYCDNLAARIEMLKADLGSLASREDQRAEALRVQMLGVMGRLDEVAAAYDAWDLMRDSLTSRLGSLERQVRELTADLLKRKVRRWKK